MKIMKSKIGILGVMLIGLIFINMYTDPIEITGVVTDESGQRLIGATVLESGIQNGVATEIDGTFSLNVSKIDAVLEVSYVGCKTQKLSLAQMDVTKQLHINLESDPICTEVVITEDKEEARFDTIGEEVTFQITVFNQGSVAKSNTPIVRFIPSHIVSGTLDDVGHNTEDYGLIKENNFLTSKDAPVSTFSIDVDAASYSSLRRFINQGQRPPIDAVRIEEMVNYFDYDYPQPIGEDPFEVITEYADCPWSKGHKLVHIGLQGKEIPKDDLPASNLVFLCDVSGSMSSPNKLPLLQSSLKMLVNNLRAEDKVSLVVYAGSSGVVLEPTGGDQKNKIKQAIDELYAGGSTAGAAGIQLAYNQARKAFVKDGNNRVILATDGDFNVGVSSDAELVRLIEKERESGVFLTVMGFGQGNYKDNKMEQLANKGNGNYAYIDNINEARKVLVSEFGGTLFTIAKDVKLQVEFNPEHVAGYRLIGYENRLLDREDFNDDAKDAGELGAGHTVTAMYEIIPAGVESSFLQSVDPLKYQKKGKAKVQKYTDELMTVKLRYKQPEGKESKLLSKVVPNAALAFNNTSDNFRWAATVGGFGMLLRESEFVQGASFNDLISLGENALGEDAEGYRAEMIRMMKNAQSMGLSSTNSSIQAEK